MAWILLTPERSRLLKLSQTPLKLRDRRAGNRLAIENLQGVPQYTRSPEIVETSELGVRERNYLKVSAHYFIISAPAGAGGVSSAEIEMRGIEVEDARQSPALEEQVLRDQIAVDDSRREARRAGGAEPAVYTFEVTDDGAD